jgi:hypothetical protein
MDRKDFLRGLGVLGIGGLLSPILPNVAQAQTSVPEKETGVSLPTGQPPLKATPVFTVPTNFHEEFWGEGAIREAMARGQGKVIVLGGRGVGKTTLASVFAAEHYRNAPESATVLISPTVVQSIHLIGRDLHKRGVEKGFLQGGKTP